MLIFLNVVNALIVLAYAAHLGWLGERIQFAIQNKEKVNQVYERELLLAIANIQNGEGFSRFTSDGFIHIKTDGIEYKIYGSDYRDEQFGMCYLYKRNDYSYKIPGTISYETRKYLLRFKEDYLNVKDPSTKVSKSFTFKKEKVTIK